MAPIASLVLERNPPFAYLRLNRPDRLNALDEAMWGNIPALVADAEADSSIRILFLSGVDATAFAAGADISGFDRLGEDPAAVRAHMGLIGGAMSAVADCVKPTVAVIQGPCIGGGCGLALCCDFRFCDPTGRFGITPSRLGIAYPLEDTRRLLAAVGRGVAKEMLMTGRIFDAEEALRVGLVDRLIPSGDLWPQAQAFAHGIAERSQYSVRAAKAVIREIDAGATAETEHSIRLFVESFAGPDLKEGTAAFLAKRKARFTYS